MRVAGSAALRRPAGEARSRAFATRSEPAIVAPRTAARATASGQSDTTKSRDSGGRGGRAAPEEAGAFHREHDFAVLVDDFRAGADQPDPRTALQPARLDHGPPHVQDVAGEDGPGPRQAFDSGRAETRRFEQVFVADHAHRHRTGVPAACREPAEERALRRRVVIEVKGLRVELPGERQHGLARHLVVAEFAHLADGEVFPIETYGWR